MRSQSGIRVRGFVFALVGGVLWGFSGACGQFLFSLGGVDSAWLTVTRLLLSGVLLLGMAACTSRGRCAMIGIWRSPSDAIRLLAFSLLGITSCQYSYLTAIAYSNAGTATVLQYVGPVLIMVIACVMTRRLPTVREVAAIVLAVGGTFVLATHGNPTTLAISAKGLFWGAMSAITLVLYTMLPGDLIRRYGGMPVVGYGMLIGGLAMFLPSGYAGKRVELDPEMLLAVAAIVVLGTAAAFTLYLQGVADIGSVKASLIASVEPVSATMFAVLWLGTSFVGIDVVGLVMIITAVVLLSGKSETAGEGDAGDGTVSDGDVAISGNDAAAVAATAGRAGPVR